MSDKSYVERHAGAISSVIVGIAATFIAGLQLYETVQAETRSWRMNGTESALKRWDEAQPAFRGLQDILLKQNAWAERCRQNRTDRECGLNQQRITEGRYLERAVSQLEYTNACLLSDTCYPQVTCFFFRKPVFIVKYTLEQSQFRDGTRIELENAARLLRHICREKVKVDPKSKYWSRYTEMTRDAARWEAGVRMDNGGPSLKERKSFRGRD